MNSWIVNFQSNCARFFDEAINSWELSQSSFSLVLFSILFGAIFLLLFRFVSFQDQLSEVKRKIHAAILECLVFKYSTFSIIRAQFSLFRHGTRYVLLNIPAALILLPIALWFLAFANQFYGYQSLSSLPLLELEVSTERPRDIFQVDITSTKEFEVLAALRSSSRKKSYFQLRSQEQKEDSAGSIAVHLKGATSLEIPTSPKLLSPHISQSILDSLLYPSRLAPFLPQGIERIDLKLEPRTYTIFGISSSWLIWFIVLSLISGLCLAWLFKIQI